MLQLSMNEINTLINNTNIKLTTARTAILELFVKASRPLSYEDVKDKLHMDKATFYRNITKFEEENLLDSFESNDKKRYYEIKKDPHAHFICSTCSSVECLHDAIPVNLPDYKIENIIVKGICPSCLTHN